MARNHQPWVAAVTLAGLFLGGLVLAACEQTTPLPASSRTKSEGDGPRPSFGQFSDIPVPGGAKMDVDMTLLFGFKDAWIGRLVIEIGRGTGAAFDFYSQEMPKFGWAEVTAVRAATSVLTYTRGNRVATIQIRGRTLGGATVFVTVSPRAGSSSAGSSTQPR